MKMTMNPADDPDGDDAEKWLTFCYTRAFQNEWKALGYSDVNLRKLEVALCRAPEAGAIIQGAGGLRKMRWALAWGGGKSGGCRIGYAYFSALGRVLVVAIFAKADQANFTAAQKAQIKQVLQRYESESR